MRKVTVILISLLAGFIIMTSGYGLWQKSLFIKGDIDVIPDPDVIMSLKSEIDDKYEQIEDKYRQIEDLIEQQKAYEEEQKAIAAQQELDAQQKLQAQKDEEAQKALKAQTQENNSDEKDSETIMNDADQDMDKELPEEDVNPETEDVSDDTNNNL